MTLSVKIKFFEWKEFTKKLMNEENEWDHKISAGLRKDKQIALGLLK